MKRYLQQDQKKIGPTEELLSSLSIVDIMSFSVSTDYFILALFSHFHLESQIRQIRPSKKTL